MVLFLFNCNQLVKVYNCAACVRLCTAGEGAGDRFADHIYLDDNLYVSEWKEHCIYQQD